MERRKSTLFALVLGVLFFSEYCLASGPVDPPPLWNTIVSNLSKRNLTLEICDKAVAGCKALTWLRVDALSFNNIGQEYPTAPIMLRVTDTKSGQKLEVKLQPDQLDPFQISGSVIYVVPETCPKYSKPPGSSKLLTKLQVWIGNDKHGNTRLGTIVVW